MQYIVVFSPKKEFADGGIPSDFIDTEKLEEAQVRVLYATGKLRQVWAQVPRTHGGVILFEADSSEDLQSMIDTFPLMKANYADAQVGPAPATCGVHAARKRYVIVFGVGRATRNARAASRSKASDGTC